MLDVLCNESPKECISPDSGRDFQSVLKQKKSKLESDLAQTNAALDALTKNPEIANVLNLVSKAVRGF